MTKKFTAEEVRSQAQTYPGITGSMLDAYADLLERPDGVPDGWKSVPVNPTNEQLTAGATHASGWYMRYTTEAKKIYDAMLAAAPQPELPNWLRPTNTMPVEAIEKWAAAPQPECAAACVPDGWRDSYDNWREEGGWPDSEDFRVAYRAGFEDSPKPERAAAEVPADERATFEVWAVADGLDIYRPDKNYMSLMTSMAWRVWQARAALAQQGEGAKLLPVLRRALQEAVHANAVTLQAAGVGYFDLNVIADMEAAIAQQAAKEGE